MKENINALRKKVEINVLTADKANAHYMRFRESMAFKALSFRYMHIVRKFLHLLFFLAVYMELKKRVSCQKSDLFLVRFSYSNYLITRHLHSKGYKILLEVHALAHIEEKEYGQTYSPPFYFPFISYLESRILSWADCITTVSGSLRDCLVGLGIDKQIIHVVHNAVDLDTFDYNTDPKSVIKEYNLENKVVCGFVGSFARYHGVEILIDVAENIQRKRAGVTFLIVGRNVHGSDDVMEKCFARGLSRVFRFTGEVPHSRIPLHIAAMDITLIPDFNDYGSPMKLFEYMAMGKAVVAPDVPPIREVIEDGITGILFKKGDVAEITKAVEELIDNAELRRSLGHRAHQRIVESYTWDKNAKKIVKIAESMT